MEVQAKSTPEQKISEMVRRIVEGFHPDKIILFGSYARGAAGPVTLAGQPGQDLAPGTLNSVLKQAGLRK